MILVAGATGLVGGEVSRILGAQGHTVRGLVRPTSSTERTAALRAFGAELVEGDLRDAPSLMRACAGVTAIISTATATGQPQPGDDVVNVDGEGQLALVDAAQQSGVEKFVFVSFSHGLAAQTALSASKRAVERRLADSSMDWTVLCPTAFMEIWLSPRLGFDVPNGQLTIYGPGTAPVSYVSLGDVARFCVAALDAPAARNTTLELGGPEPLAPLDVARIAEEVTGRPMQRHHVPVEALRAQFDGAADPGDRSFAGLMLDLAEGDAIDMTETTRRFGIQLRSVREFLEQTYGDTKSTAPEAPRPEA